MGLDQPFYIQFGRFVGRAVQGDFGLSLRQGRPVSTLLKERLPATLELAVTAALLAVLLGVPAGVYTALNRNSWLSHILLAVSLIGISLPTFLIGILLILVFAVILGWLPSFGRGDTIALGWWTTGFLTKSGLKALILPAVALAHATPSLAVGLHLLTELDAPVDAAGEAAFDSLSLAEIKQLTQLLDRARDRVRHHIEKQRKGVHT